PPENPPRLYAPGLRMWAFAEALVEAGHELTLFAAEFGETEKQGSGGGALEGPKKLPKGLSLYRLSPGAPPSLLSELIRKHQAQGVIASTDVMIRWVALGAPEVPTCFDFNGHPMAERQLQALVHEDDSGLAAQWRYIAPGLLTGDAFFTCSDPQKFALLGELGVCGRLNRHTARVSLVDAVPPWSSYGELRSTEGAIRGKVTPADACVILWTGGYNTWADTQTLLAALERAMEREPRIHFVSTGGEIKGHNEKTFSEFRAAVERSPHRERFHFCGWVASAEMSKFYRDADLAVCLDSYSVEAELGTRTRIAEWIVAQVPVATTAVCEFPKMLGDRGLVTTVRVGAVEELSDVLVSVAKNPEPFRERARTALNFLRTEWTAQRVAKPLLDWAEHPRFAPDREEGRTVREGGLRIPDNAQARSMARWLAGQAERTELEKDNAHLRRELDTLLGSRAVKTYLWLKGKKPPTI
ncbi:MAG: glycosyltransferase, partial [bacterium]